MNPTGPSGFLRWLVLGPLDSGDRRTTDAVPSTRGRRGRPRLGRGVRATMTGKRAGRAEGNTPDDESRTT